MRFHGANEKWTAPAGWTDQDQPFTVELGGGASTRSYFSLCFVYSQKNPER